MSGVMINPLSGRLPALGFALLCGIAITVMLLLMIVLLAAEREAPVMEKPLLVLDLMTWSQPAPPAPRSEPKPEPKSRPEPKPMSQPAISKPKPSPVTERISESPLPPEPVAEPEPVAQPSPPPPVVDNVVAPAVATPSQVKTEQTPVDIVPEPVPVFQLTEMPRFVHREMPVYPQTMRALGKAGVVKLEALIDHTGRVRRVTVVESAGEAFDNAAKEAIMRSTFAPGNVDGQPVAVLLRLPVKFRLL